jgi:hypothetical protein
MTDVTLYSRAEQLVAALAEDECDAVMAALERRVDRWELEHPRTATNIIGAMHGKPPVPARRRVGVLEAIRGVECCDPKTVRLWQVFRLWLAVVCVGVGVVLMLEPWHRAALIGVGCVISLAVGFSMLRGKASVCH